MTLQGPYPEPGDLIEFFRPAYRHWGVYVGKGCVVHLSDLNGFTSFLGTVIVKKDPLLLVANGDIYRVNNKEEKNKTPYPAEIIVQMALKEVGQMKEYKLTSNNCEHFATSLRYGDGFSDQVDNVVIYTAGAAAVLALVGVIAGTTYYIKKNKKQNQ